MVRNGLCSRLGLVLTLALLLNGLACSGPTAQPATRATSLTSDLGSTTFPATAVPISPFATAVSDDDLVQHTEESFLQTSTPTPLLLSPTPAGDPIVLFIHDGELWRTDVQGSGQERLADTTFYPNTVGLALHWRPPQVSPDGRFIVVPTQQGTWLLDIQSGERWRLSGDPAWVTWSPDSQALAYALRDVLYVRAVGQDEPARSLFKRSGEKILDRALAWSPLSEEIATVTVVFSGTETVSTVWLFSGQSGDAHPLQSYPIAATEYGPEALQWSPSGERLLYTLPISGAVIFTPADGRVVRLPKAYDNSAWWSPDSDHLLSLGLGAVVSWEGEIRLSLLSPDPRGPKIAAWAWSADGRRLAYVISGTDEGHELRWLDLADPTLQGSKSLEVAVTFPPQSLFWVPDGTAILLDDDRPHTPIWRWDLKGAQVRQIVQDGFLLGLAPLWAVAPFGGP